MPGYNECKACVLKADASTTPGDSQGTLAAYAVVPELPGDAVQESREKGMVCK